MNTKTIRYDFIFILVTVLLNTSIAGEEIPEEAVQLRDDPIYFTMVRGIRDLQAVRPTEKISRLYFQRLSQYIEIT